jgi:ABC-type multidrug transport system fused ATPase/permease subunit
MFELTKIRLDYLKKLLPFGLKLKRFYLVLLMLNFVIMGLQMVTPVLYKMVIEDVILNKKLNSLPGISLCYFALFVLTGLANVGKNYSANRLFNRLLFNIRYTLINIYLRMPLYEYARFNLGDLKLRIDEDVNNVEGFVMKQTYEYATAFCTIAVTGVFLFNISPVLFSIVLLVVPLTFYIGHVLGNGEKRVQESLRMLSGKRDVWLFEMIQGWREVKALHVEKRVRRIFTEHYHEIGLLQINWIFYWLMNRFIIPTLKDDIVMKLLLMFTGCFLIIREELNIGGLMMFLGYYTLFYNKLNELNISNITMKNYIPQLSRLFEMIGYKNSYLQEVSSCGTLAGDIEFRDVRFRYPGSESPVFDGLNILIPRGEKVAIVGKSGEGKSTLIKLLLQIIELQEGEISYNGISGRLIRQRNLLKGIGIVMQEPHLFHMSIKENLQMAKPDATEHEMKEACRLAFIADWIEDLPKQYDTMVGENGVKLSGGQRQRIALARAFLKNPGMIILDEATSSLDNESEKMIQKAIQYLGRNQTVIIIAHRLSSILVTDRVIVLQEGKVAAIGPHEQLSGYHPAYDELFQEQYKFLTTG